MQNKEIIFQVGIAAHVVKSKTIYYVTIDEFLARHKLEYNGGYKLSDAVIYQKYNR